MRKHLFAAALVWQTGGYQKIVLPGRIPEGIKFEEHHKGAHVAYLATYFVGEKVLRTRVISKSIFQHMENRLRLEVLSGNKTPLSGACPNHFTLITPKKTQEVCLSFGRDSHARADSFRRWYQSARAIFGL